jgi:hypothetical protein
VEQVAFPLVKKVRKTNQYKLRLCTRCLQFKQCRMQWCDTCYHKKRQEANPRSCSECGKIRPITRKSGQCHTCYERERRALLRERAALNPVLKKRLKDLSIKNYLQARERGHYTSISRRISRQVTAFKSRDPNSELDSVWFIENVLDKSCYYCGIPEANAKLLTGQRLGVDRMDPKLGYKKSNCVPACQACNTAKFKFWTPEETKKLGALIRSFYDARIGL